MMEYSKELHEQYSERAKHNGIFRAAAVCRMLDEIERLQSVEKAQEWIPVDENYKLCTVQIVEFQHGETGTCFVALAYKGVDSHIWKFLRGDQFVALPSNYTPTRWTPIPLPPPPTGGKNE